MVDFVLLMRVLLDQANLACFFFFSSRRRHTRLTCDWSSDVCSSDLVTSDGVSVVRGRLPGASEFGCEGSRLKTCSRDPRGKPSEGITGDDSSQPPLGVAENRFPSSSRSEERRVGKECRARWSRWGEK